MKKIIWSGLWKKEDWLTVWVGLIIIIIILGGVSLKVPKLKWTLPGEYITFVSRTIPSVEKLMAKAGDAGDTLVKDAAVNLQMAMICRDRTLISDASKTLAEAAALSKDKSVSKTASKLAASILAESNNRVLKLFTTDNLIRVLVLGLFYLILSLIAIVLAGEKAAGFITGFPVVFILALLGQLIAGNYTMLYYGLEYVIWALVLGLFISNVFGVPGWLRGAIKSEFYIKTGVILLGAGIYFHEIVNAGLYGLAQAVLVVSVVWYTCFWIARKLKVDDEFAAILSSAVSICGVSAAIATAGAIKGDPKKLSYTTSIVLICAVPMLIIQPLIAKLLSMPDIVAGAWLGGTLDTSGSVVAAGALISESAMKTGVVVKMSQNVLIGVAAFILSIVWAMRSNDPIPGTKRKVTILEIWYRFPKFVLGFIIASVVFSFFLTPEVVESTKSTLSGLRTWWFALAFVSIGLETRFKDLTKLGNGRPALAFLAAQGINILWTLLLAYLIFGGILFPVPNL